MSNSSEPEEIEAQVKTIARRIREERERVHVSQMELSLKAGLSQNQVFCIETGRRIPNLYTLLKICNALEINPTLLFEPIEEKKTSAKETIIRLVSKYM